MTTVETQDELLTWPNGAVVDVESIHGYAEDARRVAISPLDDGAIRTPDWVISELQAVSEQAARMVHVILKAEEFKRKAATRLERARATARRANADLVGAQQSAAVVLATTAEKDAYDDAVTAFEYARRAGNLLKDYTGRVQSIGKQVELTYRNGSL
ncbi:hypothetical protein JNB62_05545 [Microbacterium jejuense]|uniref:Uncharacterized protein n=1 Tax=Microbacterium jejuense TaxID=1263637 RepID=A0ABS7HK85_9MICO|nr:hypothetical protein [Microbacterium jejuense]MBW9093140.1 hypothetical protein [Microbacterium jejuense]